MSSHAKFINPYKSREWNQIPDLFYRYTEQSIKVYSRLQSNDLTHSISTEKLKEVANESTLFIKYVLDAAYKRKPILIIIALTEETEDIKGSSIILFWYDIFSDKIRQIILDQSLNGNISIAAMTRLPLTLMKNSYEELVNEEHLRHLLVFGKQDHSVLVVLLQDDESEDCVYGKLAEVSLPSYSPGAITALHILPQNVYDKRKGYNDPRILIGTSKGCLQVLRFKALLKDDITVVPAQNFTEFIDYDNEPINYITCVRPPHQKKMFIVVGQNTPKLSTNHTQAENEAIEQEEKTYLRVIEISGNNRRKLAAQLCPDLLKSYIISTTRIIPYENYYQITAVFQSIFDKQHFEVDVWTVKDNKVTLDVAKETIETDMQHSIQDIWPMKGKTGFMLLYPEKAINPDEDIDYEGILPLMDYPSHNYDDSQSVVTETTDRYDTSEPPSMDYFDDELHPHEDFNDVEAEDAAYNNTASYIQSEEQQEQVVNDSTHDHLNNSNNIISMDIDTINNETDYDENNLSLLNRQIDTSTIILHENEDKKNGTEDNNNNNNNIDNDVSNERICKESLDTNDEQENQTSSAIINVDDTTSATSFREKKEKEDNGNAMKEDIEGSTLQLDNDVVDISTNREFLDIKNDHEDQVISTNSDENNEQNSNVPVTFSNDDDDDDGDGDAMEEDKVDDDNIEESTRKLDDHTKNNDGTSKETLIIEEKKENQIASTDIITIDEQKSISPIASYKETNVESNVKESIQIQDNDDDNVANNEYANEKLLLMETEEYETPFNTTTVTNEEEYQTSLTNTIDNNDQNSDTSVDSNQEGDAESKADDTEVIKTDMEGTTNDGNIGQPIQILDNDNDDDDECIVISEPLNENDKQESRSASTNITVNNNEENGNVPVISINEDDDHIEESTLKFENGTDDEDTVKESLITKDETNSQIVSPMLIVNNEQIEQTTNNINQLPNQLLLAEGYTPMQRNIELQSFNERPLLEEHKQFATSPVKSTMEDDYVMVNVEDINPDEEDSKILNDSLVDNNKYRDQHHILHPGYDIEEKEKEKKHSDDHSPSTDTTSTSIIKDEFKGLSFLDCLKIARSTDENKQYEYYCGLFDMILTSSPFNIDKSLKDLEELQLNQTEENWLMKYCYEHKQAFLKLFIMHYNISHKKFNLVLMQNNSMKEQQHAIPNDILQTCNNLSKLTEKLVSPVLLDLPLDIFGDTNPFEDQNKSKLKRKRGLNFGADLVNQVVERRKSRRLC